MFFLKSTYVCAKRSTTISGDCARTTDTLGTISGKFVSDTYVRTYEIRTF